MSSRIYSVCDKICIKLKSHESQVQEIMNQSCSMQKISNYGGIVWDLEKVARGIAAQQDLTLIDLGSAVAATDPEIPQDVEDVQGEETKLPDNSKGLDGDVEDKPEIEIDDEPQDEPLEDAKLNQDLDLDSNRHIEISTENVQKEPEDEPVDTSTPQELSVPDVSAQVDSDVELPLNERIKIWHVLK